MFWPSSESKGGLTPDSRICFIPAFLKVILHILSSFCIVDLSNIRVYRLFHDSTAKEIHSCISEGLDRGGGAGGGGGLVFTIH